MPAQLPGASLLHQPARTGLTAGEVMREVRDHGVAAAASRCAATAGCDPRPAFMGASQLLLAAGDAETALAVLGWLAQQHPEAHQVQTALGEALMAAGRRADARAAFQRALELIRSAHIEPASRRRFLEARLESRIALIDDRRTPGN